jgi:hypothetical protein
MRPKKTQMTNVASKKTKYFKTGSPQRLDIINQKENTVSEEEV